VLAMALAAVLTLAGTAAVLGQGAGGAQGGPTITLTTQPAAGEIVPDELETPTKFILEARGPQGPLRNAVIDVEITAPSFGPLASSDIPAIEGTTLFRSRFGAPDGRLEFDYVLPIRGAYTVRVQALPVPGAAGAAFQPVTREFPLPVNERGSEIVNFWMLIAGLFVVGLAAGALLGYFNRGAARGA
jgi:hypothetical protein